MCSPFNWSLSSPTLCLVSQNFCEDPIVMKAIHSLTESGNKKHLSASDMTSRTNQAR